MTGTGEILTAYEVADTLGVHRNTVLRYIKENQLKAVKVGKKYVINKADLDAFLISGTAENYLQAKQRIQDKFKILYDYLQRNKGILDNEIKTALEELNKLINN